MTRRLQIRIAAAFFLVIFIFVGVFAYTKLNAAPMILLENEYVRSVGYAPSDRNSIFEIRWKKEMKASTVKDPKNYLIEHVVQKGGKWLTAVNGKKCTVTLVQHITDKMDPEKKQKVTQLSVNISPREDAEDFFRLRVRDVYSKKGEKMAAVEYGVIQVTNFAKFTKK